MGDAYRDEREAAISAIPRLRDENVALRTELAKLQHRVDTLESATGSRPPRPASAQTLARLLIAGGSVMLLVAGTLGFLATSRRAPMPVAMTPGEGRFDQGAALRTLLGVDLLPCAQLTGPRGTGYVSVTFQPDGAVGAATVEGAPLAGTAVARCVEDRYRSAHIAAFAGTSQTVRKAFSIGVPEPAYGP